VSGGGTDPWKKSDVSSSQQVGSGVGGLDDQIPF